MSNLVDQARRIIADNIYLTLATASLDGTPWISPLFFAYDSDHRLYWVSAKDSRHSDLLRHNPRAAITIFDSHAPEGEGDGVYLEVSVTELSDMAEITHAIATLNSRVTKDAFRVKNVGQVTGTGVWRIYQAKPVSVSKLTSGKYINGQYVDKRVKVDL